MNARGQRSLDRTFKALAERADHAGNVRLSHADLARRNGLQARQTQTIIHALEAAGKITRTLRRGFSNAYRVLAPWVRAMIDGEARAGDDKAAAALPDPAPTSLPPRRPAIPWAILDHHPTL